MVDIIKILKTMLKFYFLTQSKAITDIQLIHRSFRKTFLAIRNFQSSFHGFSGVLLLNYRKVFKRQHSCRWQGAPLRCGAQCCKYGQIGLRPALYIIDSCCILNKTLVFSYYCCRCKVSFSVPTLVEQEVVGL